MYNFSLPKVDGTSNQPAAEMNSVFTELENAVTGSDQSLSNSTNNQLLKALSIYAGGGDFYTDSGSVNNYVLAPIGSRVAPISYTDGMRVRFMAGNTNTSASTVNVASLGSKSIKKVDGVSDLDAGDIQEDRPCELIYNLTNDVFILNSVNGISSFFLDDNGYIQFDNGLICQWGTGTIAPVANSVGTTTVIFPVTFNSSIFCILPTYTTTPQVTPIIWYEFVVFAPESSTTLNGCVLTGGITDPGRNISSPVNLQYLAVGI